MLSIMKKRKNNWIPDDVIYIFERIISENFVPNRGSNEGDNEFMKAMGEHLTQEQRFRLFEQYGGCKGTGHDKERKAFSLEHADKPLSEKIELYMDTFGKLYDEQTCKVVLSEKNKTITVTFACSGCYGNFVKGKITSPFSLNYEHCAGGRLYNLETALGVKLKIKSVDIPPSDVGVENPCIFTFEIEE
jgi:hypothetical protein